VVALMQYIVDRPRLQLLDGFGQTWQRAYTQILLGVRLEITRRFCLSPKDSRALVQVLAAGVEKAWLRTNPGNQLAGGNGRVDDVHLLQRLRAHRGIDQ